MMAFIGGAAALIPLIDMGVNLVVRLINQYQSMPDKEAELDAALEAKKAELLDTAALVAGWQRIVPPPTTPPPTDV